ncbi:hypothetical protein GHT06_008441 [Daphnia sinensis]|uniref:DE-cadherin n=1 Tax=Daphnia sinensis TaxID=1820382 RepID=A0AAD5LL40_9CRUS|nr:hypothetical protein GHT06_008441 [Daphnia sinensis]
MKKMRCSVTAVALLLLISNVLADGSSESHHVTVRQATGGGRSNRVPDTFSTPSQQELERTGSPRSNANKRVYVENKYRPVFYKCESAALEEGKPPGTVVSEVKAYDNDTDSAGDIFFTILRAGSEKEFEVDPVTGTIRSTKSFDRDEPAREKIAYVTVKATDRGTPPLEAICTFNVTIGDINDNAPMFDKSAYDESVPRDLELNKLVMRIAATDVDAGENAHISYVWDAGSGPDAEFFDLDKSTGAIHLKKKITQNEGYKFALMAVARDNGTEPMSSRVRVVINVASSKIKPPYFTDIPESVRLPENYTSYKTPIATLAAHSNIAAPDLYFELVKGQTEQTNSDETFRINERGNSVDIHAAKALDYEKVTQYILTVRVKNEAGVAAETVLTVSVDDVNDEIPTFMAVDGGSVLENSVANTFVLKVQATDRDATYPNNWVRYELRDFKDKFEIDRNTGDISTKVKLDREERKSYPLTVVAYDGKESALTLDGLPNQSAKRFQIEVADVNDNAPFFPQSEYFAEIAENADIGAKVSELTALDNDTDSQLTYDIVSGNAGLVFSIEAQTGLLKVQQPLDYETTKSYDLIVEVDDGKQKATTKVNVKIINVNDNKPQFMNNNPEHKYGIVENTVPIGPIVRVNATDPDYDPLTADGPMKITYTLSGSHADSFQINQLGELSIVRPLDRDLPAGRRDWSVFVVAQDELDGVRLENTLEVVVFLDDVNDNAPFLDMTRVVWRENQPQGRILVLNATDYDEPKNGPPFTMRMADTAEDVVKTSFRVDGSPTSSWSLMATRTFDREERKEYAVPIIISDSGQPTSLTATSTLTVVIGDENDNPMSDGSSAILVYNYRNALPDTEIGRVYVQDADDWDLPDKTFGWSSAASPPPYFTVTAFGGFITMRARTPPGDYPLKFHVRDNVRQEEADATVIVTVQEITEEAVRRSGSIRLSGVGQEEFIKDSPSKKDLLRQKVAEYVGAKEENVDIFTVMSSSPSRNHSVDVRYSAHGSPYYDPVKLNGLTATHQDELERLLDAEVLMFGIDECLYEKNSICSEGSCTNRLQITEQPYRVATNTSTFVGVDARIVPQCVCLADEYLSSSSCSATSCLNGGTCTGDAAQPCRCIDGFQGPRCEGLDVSFGGTGWAWYDPLPTCASGYLSLTVIAQTGNGLILYSGPTAVPPDTTVSDFLAVELREGSPVLYLDLGSGTKRLELPDRSRNLVDGKAHDLEISWNQRSVQMRLGQCSDGQPYCSASSSLVGSNEYLNVNGPLQVGGITADLQKLRLALNWGSIPTDIGFSGCIQNLTFNGLTYNLYDPGFFKNATPSCAGVVLPVQTGGFGWELIIALLVSLLVLMILILVFVAYRRRSRKDKPKDFHDDIRENIINYSDEGGGEGDMTGYDLSVLRMTPDGKPLIGRSDDYGKLLKDEDLRPKRAAPGQVPDISQFLDDNKGRVDRDPDGLAYDDLRHYAYEGDGNSMGSLSSLASGTDDGDLDFECLSDFGPRFKKLADMYGDHSSESEDGEDGQQGGQSGSESWC